jgi:hypothetical protein
MGMRVLCILTSMVLSAALATTQEALRNGDPFTLTVTNVRSIAPESRVGFSKTSEVYAVTAYGSQMSYVLYCAKAAPQTGQAYTALDEYVSADLSWLHLWPVEKKAIDSLPSTTKKMGRLYRVLIIQNMVPGPKPDVACDIHSEAAKQP